MDKQITIISLKNYRLLSDFMDHVFNVYHYKNKSDFFTWAARLDAAGISWAVQNLAAGCMDDYKNKGLYNSTLLRGCGILITGVHIFDIK